MLITQDRHGQVPRGFRHPEVCAKARFAGLRVEVDVVGEDVMVGVFHPGIVHGLGRGLIGFTYYRGVLKQTKAIENE